MTKDERLVEIFIKKHPHSNLAKIVSEAGLEIGAKIRTRFNGETISIPANSTLYRTAMPEIIREELGAIMPGSKLYSKTVRLLSKRFKKSKGAIMEMFNKGEFVK